LTSFNPVAANRAVNVNDASVSSADIDAGPIPLRDDMGPSETARIRIGDKRISRSVPPRRFVLRRTTFLRFGPPEDPDENTVSTKLYRLDADAQRQLSA